jgi:hypothetical protein
MFHIAAQKKRENIAEYLIFMWQMEDLLRGVDFDVEKLNDTILAAIEDEDQRADSKRWFQKLAAEMRSDKAEVSGHHRETYELLSELHLLQNTMLTVINDERFRTAYFAAKPLVDEFRLKADKIPKGDVETALTATYGFLTLRLAGKKISEETRAAVRVIAEYLAQLASAYRDLHAGKLPLNN